MIQSIRIPVIECTEGIYLRWWYNGWHYFNFMNDYEVTMKSSIVDVQVTGYFSPISRSEIPTRTKSSYSYRVSVEGIAPGDIAAFTGLLIAEVVEQYEDGWREVEITRGKHTIMDAGEPAYRVEFEVTRKEMPGTSSVYQESQYLYVEDVLCDLEEEEIIPINKQINDIAELQDRQSDFTGSFRIKKTRRMRALFELAGEPGANTEAPYIVHNCRLVQDGIEIVSMGMLIIDSVDEYYYTVSMLSGNLNFFNAISDKTINELELSGTAHTWGRTDIAASHASQLDYIYPLFEPSDDGGLGLLIDTGTVVNMWQGHLWPFVRVKAIWDEIFANAGYTYEGELFDSATFENLLMPIVSSTVTESYANKFKYALGGNGKGYFMGEIFRGTNLINGTSQFLNGTYVAPFTAKYVLTMYVAINYNLLPLKLYVDGLYEKDLTDIGGGYFAAEYEATSGEKLTVRAGAAGHTFYHTMAITEIEEPTIGAATVFDSLSAYLPDIEQGEFVKMICNMFGLVAEAYPRERKVKFWDYNKVYDNISIARDWSDYLSEIDYNNEFRFGDYAQNNHLRYADSDDVRKGQGNGVMQINDRTLPINKEAVELPVSSTDEIVLLGDVVVSRIGVNSYDEQSTIYKSVGDIDPRIVFGSQVVVSPAKTFRVREDNDMFSASTDIANPWRASSREISFAVLSMSYASLSRMLTRSLVRKAYFNLPVYEVAGINHQVPVFISQYKSYFYINKISNYVPGKLCIVDLIKL